MCLTFLAHWSCLHINMASFADGAGPFQNFCVGILSASVLAEYILVALQMRV